MMNLEFSGLELPEKVSRIFGTHFITRSPNDLNYPTQTSWRLSRPCSALTSDENLTQFFLWLFWFIYNSQLYVYFLN
jgi:hypothetical protein